MSPSDIQPSPVAVHGDSTDYYSSSSEKAQSELELETAGPAPVKRVWYRSTITQAHIIGVVSFCAPGCWNALNGTGGGGNQSPYVANAANAIVFGLMVLFCFLGSAFFNRVGLKWALVVATVLYFPYGVGLWSNKTSGKIWIIYFSSSLCGIGAGLFWAVEGAIILGYPEARKRGRYLAVWLGWKSLGSVVGGAITLGLNVATNGTGSVSSNTYFVFIALMACAPFVSLLLSPPEKVQREDNTPVIVGTLKHGFLHEMKEVLVVLIRKEVLLLMPLAFFSSLMGPWTSTYLGLYFSVRARALASLVNAIIGVIANFALGAFLDWEYLSLKTRTRSAFAFLAALGLASWIWGIVVQADFDGRAVAPKFDWVDSGFARAWTVNLLWNLVSNMLQAYLYFCIGGISRGAHDMGRLSSILRSVESIGSSVAYGVTSRKKLNHFVPLGLDVGFFFVTTIVGWFSVVAIGTTVDGGYGIHAASEESTAVSSTTEVDRVAVEKTLHAKEVTTGPQ